MPVDGGQTPQYQEQANPCHACTDADPGCVHIYLSMYLPWLLCVGVHVPDGARGYLHANETEQLAGSSVGLAGVAGVARVDAGSKGLLVLRCVTALRGRCQRTMNPSLNACSACWRAGLDRAAPCWSTPRASRISKAASSQLLFSAANHERPMRLAVSSM